MDGALILALEPVLRDLRETRVGVSLHPGESPSDDAAFPRAILWAQDGSGTGVQIHLADRPVGQIVALAGTVQDIVIEDFLHTPWPECILHPWAGHPLLAMIEGDHAVWHCPTAKVVIARVGALSVQI